jgi:hypothetical protein
MKKLFFICLLLVGTAFAAETSDSLGAVGNIIVDKLSKIKFVGDYAGAIYVTLITGLGWLLTMLLQSVFKGMPTRWYWNEKTQALTVSLIWKILAKIFGNSILFYNVKVETPQERELALAKTRKHFLEHDPVLSIKVKDLMK